MAHRRVRVTIAALAGCAALAAIAGLGAQAPATRTPPAAAPQGQTPASQVPPQPTFRAGISFVRVDVIVSDSDGHPVTDLTQADFEVLEDGQPQKVETFKLVEITGIPQPGDERPREIRSEYDEEVEASRDDVRLFVIFFDDYHVRRGSAMSVREPLLNFVNNQIGPADLVGLMYPLTPVSAIGLTRNRSSLAGAIRSFEGRRFDYKPRNLVEERYADYPVEVVERIRNQVTLSALEGLVIHLGALREGRKAVILVSEGFSNYVPPQLRDPDASKPGWMNPNRGNPTAGEGNLMEDRARLLSAGDLHQELREVYDAANRNNTAIYALDPRGLAPYEYDINQSIGMQMDRAMLDSTLDSLRVLADNTDGRAIVNRNDLDGGLKQLIRDSSAYFLLGYNSSRAPADGKFHEIKVRVRRPGVQVRARKGYWAPGAEDVKKALAPPAPEPPAALTKALSAIADPPRGRFIRSWVGTSKGPDGRTRVSLVWEPLPPEPGTTRVQPSQVTLVAMGADSRVYFRGRVPRESAAAGPSDLPPGAPIVPPSAPGLSPPRAFRVDFDAAPGATQLRLSVHGSGDDVLDTEVREVMVPDFTAPVVAIGSPAVFRTANAREFQAVKRDANAVPTTSREFRRTERLLVRFEAYGPGESRPAVKCRLLNRTGGAMSDLQAAAGGGASFEIDLPLSGLVGGVYFIEITATGADSEATELIALRVVG